MPKKKRDNPQMKIAKKMYLDPESPTFLNKMQSMIAAGYSKLYAEHRGWEKLDTGEFTDADVNNFTPLIKGLPKLIALTNKKMSQMATDEKISAKDYSAMLKHIELIAKCVGIIKERIEKTERIVKIEVPAEIVKQEYERRKQSIDLDINLSKDIKPNKEENKKNI